MKHILSKTLLAICCLTLAGCGGGNNENNKEEKFTVTFKCTNYNANSGIWSNSTYSREYAKGDTIYEPKYPDERFAWGKYALDSNFSYMVSDPNELRISESTTVYVKYYGKVAYKINFCMGTSILGSIIPPFNEQLYKLPSLQDNGVYCTSYTEKPSPEKAEWNINIASAFYGYSFDGNWYKDEACTQKINLPYKIDDVKGVSHIENFYCKKGPADQHTVEVNYIMRGSGNDINNFYTIGSKSQTMSYDSDLKTYIDQLPSNVSNDYVIASASDTYAISDNGGTSYSAFNPSSHGGWISSSNLLIKVQLTPKYNGYMLVGSTNANINNKYLPTSALSEGYFDDSETYKDAIPFGASSSVSFKLSEITSITFPICTALPSSEQYDLRNSGKTHYPNLTSLDFSNAKYVSSIPESFFNNCPKLETVVGTNLENLKTINKDFLSYNHIKYMNIDFSHVTKISNDFLLYSFDPSFNSTVNIDLSSLTSRTGNMLMHDGSTGKINLHLGSYTGIYADTFSTNWPRSGSYSSTPIKTTMPITIYTSRYEAISSAVSGYSNITVIAE